MLHSHDSDLCTYCKYFLSDHSVVCIYLQFYVPNYFLDILRILFTDEGLMLFCEMCYNSDESELLELSQIYFEGKIFCRTHFYLFFFVTFYM